MRRFLLDTNAAGDLIEKRGNVPVRAQTAQQSGGKIGIGIPVLAELHYGAEFSSTRIRNLKKLQRAKEGLVIWPFDEKAAAEFGRLRADLRRAGRPMQIIDVMIAAIAVSMGNTTVVSADSDLRSIAGLNVEDWRI